LVDEHREYFNISFRGVFITLLGWVFVKNPLGSSLWLVVVVVNLCYSYDMIHAPTFMFVSSKKIHIYFIHEIPCYLCVCVSNEMKNGYSMKFMNVVTNLVNDWCWLLSWSSCLCIINHDNSKTKLLGLNGVFRSFENEI
jgi:hypothetical protein